MVFEVSILTTFTYKIFHGSSYQRRTTERKRWQFKGHQKVEGVVLKLMIIKKIIYHYEKSSSKDRKKCVYVTMRGNEENK